MRRLRVLALAIALVVPLPSAWAAEPLTADQVEQVERIIREYLLRNPDLLVEMSNRLRAQQEQARAQRLQRALATRRADLVADPNSHVAGNPSGDVTIVEFFDYQCGYCKRVHPTMTELLQRDRGVKLVLKELPILGPGSETAARAAIAALSQPGKYHAFHVALMQAEGALDEASVLAVARRVGLDVAKLAAEMTTRRVTDVIAANRELAAELGIDGTPAFIVGDRLVPGAVSLDRLVELVEQQRRK